MRRRVPIPRCPRALSWALLASCALVSCRTTRTLEVTSDPPGATVRLDEEVIGQTPLEYPFDYYGRRRLTLYLPGYRTWSRRINLKPPWYSRFPLDFVTEVLLPLGIDHRYPYDATLREDTGIADGGEPAIEAFVQRAAEMREAEQGSLEREEPKKQ